jgi:DNA-binding XRE family transcriptional regulator
MVASRSRSWLTSEEGAVVREVYDPAGLGRSIRALRRAKGWTQAQLAAWVGVSRQTVIALEQGGPVSMSVAVKAISLLGSKLVIVPKDAVMTGSERGS